MKSIKSTLQNNKILVSDGGWGTYLYKKGLQMGDCPELWNETHRSDVLEIAKSYIEAGADMIETNSFGGSKIKLEQYDLGERTYELNKLAAEISREAAGKDKFVLGSVGPTGKFLMMGEVTEEELYDSFKVQVKGLRDGGVDAICIETFYDTQEAIIAIDAVKKNSDLEVITTFTFDKAPDGSYNSMMGVKPSQMAENLANAGVDIFGTNCGNGFEGMIEIVKEIRRVNKELPILVHANAGLPIEEDGKTIYPDSPERMAELTPSLIDAGANIIGGCCGTTPKHIKAIKEVVDSIKL
ncbi:MAG: homocysteine S-methyltransferase family protein [Bacteroidota bacterium]